ncbi:MAG: hypothetical protein IMZ65_03100, partial [Planctomycetes bacterium]|nr:hypothetical protein [Planctomycetota bacterium]
LYRATGSLAFIAAARAGWLVIADPDRPERRLLLPAKSNLAKEPTGLAYALESVDVSDIGPVGRVVWQPEPVTMTADEALAREAADVDPEDRTARDSATDWLRETLANGPMAAKDVEAAAKVCGLAWHTVCRAKKAVGVKTSRQGFGPGAVWYWSLPDGAAETRAIDGNPPIDGQHNGLDTYGANAVPEGAK